MKTKIFLLIAILFVSSFVNAELFAGDKWKCTSIYHSGELRLTGEDLLFKITIKNNGDKRTKGDQVPITYKLFGGNNEIGTKTMSITPPATDVGSSYTFEITVSVSNGLVYQKIVGTLKNETNLDGMSETFSVQKIR